MGSEGSNRSIPRSRTFSYIRKHYINEFSLSSLAGRLSGHFSTSTATLRSTRSTSSSTSRPWSRVSRKVWKESTLESSYQCVKSAWPVPVIEAIFLPEFKIEHTKEKEYEIINVISRGAFGKVYRVLHNESEDYLAMKILNKSKILRDNCVSQVKDEVKIQLMCGHHPFIINSPQYWQSRRKIFIVSQYIDGGDLYELTKRYGDLPEDLVQIYIAELASALDFLHNAGVIYRDLKPENILLDSDGHAILIDFGLSKWLKYGQRTATLCGTFQYMAPEIFSMNGYGHAVDWWALGILACYLLTNKFANSGNSKTPGQLPEDVSLSTGALDLLKRLLVSEPTKRLRSVLTLQTLPFFMGFDIARVKQKTVRPRDILEKYFPDGPVNPLEMVQTDVVFFEFENMSPSIV